MPEARADNILMQKVRDGDLAKMAVLFERHHRALFRYFLRLTGSRELSEDLVQDTLERAWNKYHLWRPGSDLRAWLFAIMHNVFVNQLRKKIEPVPPSPVYLVTEPWVGYRLVVSGEPDRGPTPPPTKS